MKLGINGKTAFVAASSSGIGYAVAEALAAEGCAVILCAHHQEKLTRSGERIRRLCNVPVSTIVTDLDDAVSVDSAIKRTLEHFGGIDILVTNNGGPRPGSFDDLSESDFADGWQRTFMSTVRLIRGFADCMKDQMWGRIINITSISVKQPVPRLLLSNAYRAAVTGFAKTLAGELGPSGITVNNIAPGYIETARLQSLIHDRALQHECSDNDERVRMTQLVPAGRLGMPSEVGALAAFLASDLAAYINGSTILVDGGLYSGVI